MTFETLPKEEIREEKTLHRTRSEALGELIKAMREMSSRLRLVSFRFGFPLRFSISFSLARPASRSLLSLCRSYLRWMFVCCIHKNHKENFSVFDLSILQSNVALMHACVFADLSFHFPFWPVRGYSTSCTVIHSVIRLFWNFRMRRWKRSAHKTESNIIRQNTQYQRNILLICLAIQRHFVWLRSAATSHNFPFSRA